MLPAAVAMPLANLALLSLPRLGPTCVWLIRVAFWILEWPLDQLVLVSRAKTISGILVPLVKVVLATAVLGMAIGTVRDYYADHQRGDALNQ